MSLYLKRHQSYSLSKFEEFDLLCKSGVLRDFQLWHPVSLMPLEVQGHVLPFWKPPINMSQDLDCHGGCSTVNVCQAMLKNRILLISYYKRLKTNAQDCRRYPTSWAKHFPITAQLAGYLTSSKNHAHERTIFSKQTFYQIL